VTVRMLTGDCRSALAEVAPGSVSCAVTSPPYWGGLRDYGIEGQIGLERQPEDYAAVLVEVFRGVRRALAADGSLWVNVGDVYAASGKGGGGNQGDRHAWATVKERKGFRMPPAGYKMKDLTLVAFQLADALRRDGWYLRSTIIWRKPAAVEPMRLDRPAVSHEYLFLLTPGEHCRVRNPGEAWWGHTVWEIAPENDAEHPAAYPPELPRRCIVASTQEGDTVLDPFSGHGTTGMVADRLKRSAVVIELNPTFAAKADTRIRQDLFAEVQ
jgi:site-specific DNA-methyltransferase (cytosine-N4-specific)